MSAERLQKKQIFVQLMQVKKREDGLKVEPVEDTHNYLYPTGGPFVTPNMIERMTRFIGKRGSKLDQGRGITFAQRVDEPAYKETELTSEKEE